VIISIKQKTEARLRNKSKTWMRMKKRSTVGSSGKVKKRL